MPAHERDALCHRALQNSSPALLVDLRSKAGPSSWVSRGLQVRLAPLARSFTKSAGKPVLGAGGHPGLGLALARAVPSPSVQPSGGAFVTPGTTELVGLRVKQAIERSLNTVADHRIAVLVDLFLIDLNHR
jgi:hypothetical protein